MPSKRWGVEQLPGAVAEVSDAPSSDAPRSDGRVEEFSATDARQELRGRIFPDASDGFFLLLALGKRQRKHGSGLLRPRAKRRPVPGAEEARGFSCGQAFGLPIRYRRGVRGVRDNPPWPFRCLRR
jgi:hypothetical protein